MKSESQAFTLIELAVVAAVLGILAICLLPAHAYTKPKAERLNCSNNLRQVGVAFRTWSAANDGRMPMNEAPAQGGDSGDVGRRILSPNQSSSQGVSMMFLVMSNELKSAKILFCPAEYEINYRHAATTFAGTVSPDSNAVPYTNDLNVSYFIGVDVIQFPDRMLLVGDHNLGGNGDPPTTAFLSAPNIGNPFWSLGNSFNVGGGPAWMDNMHGKRGNVALADGSVEWFDRTSLQDALKKSGDTGRTAGSFALATGAISGFGCNRIQLP